MTNTLHRYGNADSFRDDYIIFAIPSVGKNDKDSVPKLKQFLRICAKHEPSNMGNGNQCSLEPEKGVGPLIHWKRKAIQDWETVDQLHEKLDFKYSNDCSRSSPPSADKNICSQ